jgi:hypothetical protein
MKIYKILTKSLLLSLLLLTGFWANGQGSNYKLLTRGKPCPFDTAVAVQIKTYRLESRKFEIQDSLNTSLQAQVKTLEAGIKKAQKISAVSDSISEVRLNLLTAKTTYATALASENQKLKSNLAKSSKWYRQPMPYLVLGVLTGFLIAK